VTGNELRDRRQRSRPRIERSGSTTSDGPAFVRFLSERDGFFETYREVTASLSVRGNLVPDAHIATILRQHEVRVFYTADRDFRRFAFLDVRDPFTPSTNR
jgi:predicted nucleic acid-binding protein